MIRIVFIGYMGVGKTTIGRQVAKALNIPFYDLDWYIETRMRKSISELFEDRGECGFRQLEHNMLHEVAEFEDVVISCGGGTPCFFDNIDYMNERAYTIYLKSSPKILLSHLNMSKTKRPLLSGKNEDEKLFFIEQQLKTRESFYKKAKCTIEIDLLDSKEKIKYTVDTILYYINNEINRTNLTNY